MKIVVTGASGNLGTALLRRLADESDVEVVGVARRTPTSGSGGDPTAPVRWVGADLGHPSSVPVLERALDGADAVVHLAWRIQPSRDETAMRAVNVDGTRRVLTAAAGAGVPHVVHASSVGAYAPRTERVPASGGLPVGDGPGRIPGTGEDWPTTGIRTSAYSRQKAAAERVVDQVQRDHPQLRVARLRPGLVLQGAAGSEIGRYFLGPLLPLGLVRRVRLPVLPLPREVVFQAVHASDVAEAVLLMLRARADGPFNLVTDPVLTPVEVAAALRVERVLTVPVAVLRALAALTYAAHLQPTDPGWVDLLTQVPLLSSARARDELGWRPRTGATVALREVLDGMADGHGASTPPLRPRGALRDRTPPGPGVSPAP